MGDAKGDGQGPPQLSMEQYQAGQVQVTMAMAGQGQLPTLAPAPMQGGMQGQGPQQSMQGGGSPMQQGGAQQQQQHSSLLVSNSLATGCWIAEFAEI